MNDYALEDVRAFFVRRVWAAEAVLGKEGYESLKKRKLALNQSDADLLRAFAMGWLITRGGTMTSVCRDGDTSGRSGWDEVTKPECVAMEELFDALLKRVQHDDD